MKVRRILESLGAASALLLLAGQPGRCAVHDLQPVRPGHGREVQRGSGLRLLEPDAGDRLLERAVRDPRQRDQPAGRPRRRCKTTFRDFRAGAAARAQAQVPGRVHPDQVRGRTPCLRRSIVFNGNVYSVGLPVQGEFKWDAWRFGYEYDFIYRDRGFLGVIAEAKYTHVSAELDVAGHQRVRGSQGADPGPRADRPRLPAAEPRRHRRVHRVQAPRQRGPRLRRPVLRLRRLRHAELHQQLRRDRGLPPPDARLPGRERLRRLPDEGLLRDGRRPLLSRRRAVGSLAAAADDPRRRDPRAADCRLSPGWRPADGLKPAAGPCMRASRPCRTASSVTVTRVSPAGEAHLPVAVHRPRHHDVGTRPRAGSRRAASDEGSRRVTSASPASQAPSGSG